MEIFGEVCASACVCMLVCVFINACVCLFFSSVYGELQYFQAHLQ